MDKNAAARGADEDIAGGIFRVGVKTPPFWPEDPELWFQQLEIQFTLSNVTTDSTKFFYALSQLDHTYISQVKDIIRDPPATGKFEKLKVELTKRLSASREKQLRQLFMHEDMGDRKPTHFLRHLKNLAGPSVSDELLLSLWSGRLPHNLQTLIASQQPRLGLDELAELADRVHEMAPPLYPQVASQALPSTSQSHSSSSTPFTQPQSSQSSSSTSDHHLKQEIAQLTKEIAKLTSFIKQDHSRSRSRSRTTGSRGRSRSRTRQPPADHPHCWYHYNFGARARKCSQPCEFKAGNAGGSRK